MKVLSMVLSRKVLLAIQIVIISVFGFLVYRLNVLPLKYFIPLIILLIIVSLLLYKGQKDEKHSTLKATITKIINVLLSIVLVFAAMSIYKGNSVLEAITGANSQTLIFSIVVKAESTYTSINDLKDKTIAACEATDEVNINKVKTLMEDDIDSLVLNDYSSLEDAGNALLNEQTDGMILREIDREGLNDSIDNFDDQTKVIKQYEIKIASAKANKAKVTKEPFNVLICGTDQSGPISTFGLADVDMIATINPTTKQIYLTSIPRDYYVDIDGYDGKDKLTHSAKSSEGINCTIKTIENLMDIDINYYVKLNFTSFMNIVDAIGGVDIEIPYYSTKNGDGTFTTKIYNYYMEPGETHMDAKHALAFVRERKSFIDGDNVRGKNQQLMIKAIINKLCSASVVTNLNGIFEAVSDSLETNMTSSEVKSLINMEMDDLSPWDIDSYRLTGENQRTTEFVTVTGACPNPNGLFVVIPDQTSIDLAKSYIESVMNGEIIDIEE